MTPANLDTVATRQHGLATSGQLASLGWTEEQVRHAAARGRIERVRHGVWRAAGAPRTRTQAWLAAVLAAPGSVLSHASAGALWGLPFLPDPERIDLLREGTRPRLEGVAGHTTLSLPNSHVTVRRSVPVTTAERTITDCCGLVTPKQLASAVADGRRRRLIQLPRLARVVDEVPVSGRRAIRPMVDYLGSNIDGSDLGDSDPEVDIVDVGWPDVRVGYEYDSVAFHEHRFHEDRDRWRGLRRAGWDVWPITSTTTRNEILAIATSAFGREPVPGPGFAPGSGEAVVSGAGCRAPSRARRGRGSVR